MQARSTMLALAITVAQLAALAACAILHRSASRYNPGHGLTPMLRHCTTQPSSPHLCGSRTSYGICAERWSCASTPWLSPRTFANDQPAPAVSSTLWMSRARRRSHHERRASRLPSHVPRPIANPSRWAQGLPLRAAARTSQARARPAATSKRRVRRPCRSPRS